MAWTNPKTWAFQEGLTSANFNLHIRDNLLAVGPHLVVRKTSDETVTSSTILQDDNQLILPVLANEIWRFRFDVIYSAVTATGDIKVAFTFPAGGEIAASGVSADEGGTVRWRRWDGTSSPTAASAIIGFGATTKDFFVIDGTFITAGTAGNVTMQWAQNTSNGTATTVRTHSTLWAVKLA